MRALLSFLVLLNCIFANAAMSNGKHDQALAVEAKPHEFILGENDQALYQHTDGSVAVTTLQELTATVVAFTIRLFEALIVFAGALIEALMVFMGAVIKALLVFLIAL